MYTNVKLSTEGSSNHSNSHDACECGLDLLELALRCVALCLHRAHFGAQRLDLFDQQFLCSLELLHFGLLVGVGRLLDLAKALQSRSRRARHG
jgi:hypothetical protein